MGTGHKDEEHIYVTKDTKIPVSVVKYLITICNKICKERGIDKLDISTDELLDYVNKEYKEYIEAFYMLNNAGVSDEL